MVLLQLLRRFFLVLALGLLFLGKAGASPEQDFQNQAQADYQSIDNYVNAQFAKSMGFITTLGWNTPPDVFDIVSGPRVEIGVGAGADLMGLPDLNKLSLGAINLGSNFNLPSAIPFPFPVITGRVGLENGLDFGVKFLYLPTITLPDVNFSGNFWGWGLDLRYKMLDGVYLPTVTVGVSLDSMQGNFALGTAINQTSSYTDPGTSTTYNNITFTGTNNYTLNWNTKSFGAQVQVGKDLKVVYPFAAIGFQRNSGSITSSMTGSGTLTIPSPGSNTPTPVSVSATNVAAPVYFEPKFVLGLDFGQGLHWAVVGESNGTDIAGSTSFRVQF